MALPGPSAAPGRAVSRIRLSAPSPTARGLAPPAGIRSPPAARRAERSSISASRPRASGPSGMSAPSTRRNGGRVRARPAPGPRADLLRHDQRTRRASDPRRHAPRRDPDPLQPARTWSPGRSPGQRRCSPPPLPASPPGPRIRTRSSGRCRNRSNRSSLRDAAEAETFDAGPGPSKAFGIESLCWLTLRHMAPGVAPSMGTDKRKRPLSWWSGAGSNCRLPLFRRDPSVAARRWKESDRPLSWEDCRWLWLDVAGCLLPLAPALAPGIPNT